MKVIIAITVFVEQGGGKNGSFRERSRFLRSSCRTDDNNRGVQSYPRYENDVGENNGILSSGGWQRAAFFNNTIVG